MSEEPTVLDFVKALLTPWRGAPPPIPPGESVEDVDEPVSAGFVPDIVGEPDHLIDEEISTGPISETESIISTLPWRALVALGLALIAQLSLEPGPDRIWVTGLALYIFASAWVIWSSFRNEWVLPSYPLVEHRSDALPIRSVYLLGKRNRFYPPGILAT